MDFTLKERTVVRNALRFLLVRQAPDPCRWSWSFQVPSGLLPWPAGRLASGFSLQVGSPGNGASLTRQLCTLSPLALEAAREEQEGSGPGTVSPPCSGFEALVLLWKDLCGLDSVPGGSLLSSI